MQLNSVADINYLARNFIELGERFMEILVGSRFEVEFVWTLEHFKVGNRLFFLL